MNNRDDRLEPDWGWPAPVEFADGPFTKNPVIASILLGGMFAGFIIAIWHLVGM